MKKILLAFIILFIFFSPVKAALTEEYPKISYEKPSNDWVKELTLSFNLIANNGLKSYSFGETEDSYEIISGNSYDLDEKITKNGTYYLKVKDNKDNETIEKIEINTIDDIKPTINNLSVVEKGKYSLIKVKAIDEETGLDEKPYSFDNGTTWTDKDSYEVTIEKTYEVLVRDKVGNIVSMDIDAKVKDSLSPVVTSIINGEEKDGTKKITLVLLNSTNSEILIKESGKIPTDNDIWSKINSTTYITYLKEGRYTVYLRNQSGKTSTKDFTVNFSNKQVFNIKTLLFVAPILLMIVGLILVRKRKINNI